jgi:hypothetical protein
MTFDSARYEREVIRPMRGRHGRLADEDLLRRYAVDPQMSPAELQSHLRQLRTYWNQTAGGPDSKAHVCKQLLSADEELRRTVGEQMNQPAWWAEQAQRQEGVSRAAIAQLVTDLTEAYGSVKQVTGAQLTGVSAHYPALSEAQVQAAARKAGLRVIEAVELPTGSGLDRIAYQQLGQKLRELTVPTVVHLLHPELNKPFTLVRSFGVPGGPRLELTAAVVAQRSAAAERAADSPVARARKAALRLLDSGLKTGADLRTIALFQVVERLSAARAEGLADVLLVRQATRIGLTQEDADLLVASLPTVLGSAHSGAGRIRDLLADGQLRAAQQALTGLPSTDPERADVQEQVRQRQAEFERLLQAADDALRARREEEAERLVRDAQRIAADDPDLETRVGRLPLPPPRELAAVERDAAVRLTWQPPSSAAREVRYRVVRGEGRVPASPGDGVEIEETTSTRSTDPTPPVAQETHYAVFATADRGGIWSRAATTSIRLVPVVGEVTLDTRADQIAASWTAHPSLVKVLVRRTNRRPPAGADDGKPLSAGRTSFVDRAVSEGEQYYYGITAVYHDERRREVRSATTVVPASPRSEARPLDGLEVLPIAADRGAVRVRLSWPTAAGQIRVRYASAPPVWEFGAVISVAELDRFGREAVGALEVDGARTVLEVDVPTGPRVYVPFAIGGSGAVVGRPVEVGQTEPVRQLQARRTGAQLVLSWIWPVEVNLAEVTWVRPDDDPLIRRLTRSEYLNGSGCVLPVGHGGGRATVVALTIGPTGTPGRSAPSEVEVAGRAIGISYQLSRSPGLRNRLSRRRLLRLVADQSCTGVALAVVVTPGLVMPLRVEQGTVVERFTDLAFSPGAPLAFELELPDGVRKPYWIRCFATSPEHVTMVDPPVAELKVA